MSLTNEQIEARKKTIGGSDIGAILGENNYKTAYEVWEEKVEGKTINLSRNKAVVIGNLLESALIEKYERDYKKICTTTHTFFHRDHEFLTANLDGVSVSDDSSSEYSILDIRFLPEKKILEIKTASVFNKDEWGPSGSQIIPKHYYAQIAHYMLVTGYKSADVFVGFVDDSIVGDILCQMNISSYHIGTSGICFSETANKMETRLYTFHRDEEMEELILEAAISFYNNHMEPWIERGEKIPPPMDFSNKKFQECLRKKYDIIEESEIRLPKEFVEVKNKYLLAMSQSKKFDKVAQEEKSRIVEAMGNNQKATLGDGSYFSRKTIKRKGTITKDCEYIKFEFKQDKE